MILSNEQRIGAMILCGIALVGWLVVAIVRSPSVSEMPEAPKEPEKSKSYRTWEERKDSMRLVDSLRYAQWAAEREQRYDSFRLADSLRRAEWKRERQQQYDSFRLADSLWRDSVGWKRIPHHEKRDTVLDLNHCDTSELQLIRGIGPYTAAKIVAYRERLGGYCSPGQLTDDEFNGLRLDTLLSHFQVDTSEIKPINVNVGTASQLSRHPYIRFEQAKAIYTLRRKRVRLHSIDELRALPEIPDSLIERLRPYLSFDGDR